MLKIIRRRIEPVRRRRRVLAREDEPGWPFRLTTASIHAGEHYELSDFEVLPDLTGGLAYGSAGCRVPLPGIDKWVSGEDKCTRDSSPGSLS